MIESERNWSHSVVSNSLLTPWTVAYQAPPSMGFSMQECWSGLSFPSPEDLPNPGIEPRPPAMQADTLPSEPPRKPITKCKSVSVRYYFTPIRLLLLLLLLSCFSRVRLCATSEPAAHQAPPSLGFSRQEYWSGVPLLSPNEEMEPKQKHHPVVNGTDDRSKVPCCKEQYCIGTWNVRSMNQGKL